MKRWSRLKDFGTGGQPNTSMDEKRSCWSSKSCWQIPENPKGGTTFLVQGPPGVGKTALLAKCWDEAEEQGWNARNLPLPALWNPHEMRKCLGIRPQKRTTEKLWKGRAKLSSWGEGRRESREIFHGGYVRDYPSGTDPKGKETTPVNS